MPCHVQPKHFFKYSSNLKRAKLSFFSSHHPRHLPDSSRPFLFWRIAGGEGSFLSSILVGEVKLFRAAAPTCVNAAQG